MKPSSESVNLFKTLRNKTTHYLLVAGFAIVIIKLFSLYISADSDDGRWQQFKTEHHCIQQHGQEGSPRLSWKCDDGKTYFGWRQQR